MGTASGIRPVLGVALASWALTPVVLALAADGPAEPERAAVPGEILAACRDALPDELRAPGAETGALGGESAAGRWEAHPGQMDGSGSPEVLLVISRPDRKVEILFFAEREGKDPQKKKVSLGGSPSETASVQFAPFGAGRSLAHVRGDGSGQVLLHWSGKKLEKVWQGKSREGERHWFDVEDLDGDGFGEVISWVQREVDVYFVDEQEESEEGGGDERGATHPVEVRRYEDGRWKKSSELLEGIR